MPRRHRSPSTAREIGAYLCGARLYRQWAEAARSGIAFFYPIDAELVKRLAGEDAEIMASMNEVDWWHSFWQGWDQAYQ